MASFSAVVLAAGRGKRTHLPYPKVLHPLCGKPMLAWVLDAIRALKPEQIVTVASPEYKTEIAKTLESHSVLAIQKEPLGTGHAIGCAIQKLKKKTGTLLVACGDTPLITTEIFQKLLDFHRVKKGAATLLTAILDAPTGYGRIIRTGAGQVQEIVEEKDALESIKEIHEINAGTYCFELEELIASLPSLTRKNIQKEYYLTDSVGWMAENNRKVYALSAEDPSVALGVNTLKELSEAMKLLNHRLKETWLSKGVVFSDPDSVFLDANVAIGPGTVILPFTFIQNGTQIGSRCSIGPFVRISNSVLGDEVVIQNSVMSGAEVGNHCSIGPYAYVRPGTRLLPHVKVGDFVEVKNSTIGKSSKVPHLSYVGDAVLGEAVNIGAGTITCNYDGKGKHRTIIEDGAFIGSNTNLVAPVRVGKGAVTGAGSVVTENVEPKSVVVGVPAKKIKWKVGDRSQRETDRDRSLRDLSRRRKRHGG